MEMQLEKFSYDNKIVRNFLVATAIFGLVGFLVGLLLAIEMFWPRISGDLPILSFGRLRPLHTNAVIFAFVGNGIFAGVYYSVQRLCKARMFNDTLSKIHFWGWQLIIVAAAITLPLGITTGKEYAELEWPIDISIALIWVVFGINLIGTIVKRRVKHIYVAIWFYLASWITVTMLHLVNSFEMPVTFLKSYSWYAGVQDALVQWWYGHNAVAFFLTTTYLGLMYYFVPKASGRPVFSYRLSIIHFWALIFIYIWAGPHHLLYTALPDWAQSLGTVFSIMLIAPSWGGMLNGLLTLRGAWDKVRDDVVLKFMVVALTAYGMATFEGPMLSLKSLNALTHYTDWVVAHVHIGALGWNGCLTFGMFYFLVPRMFNTKLYSQKLANWHFWLTTISILFYAIPIYWAGIVQNQMWREFNPDGTLTNQNFLDTVTQLIPMYMLRALGGLIFIAGVIVMFYNLIKTVKTGKLIANEEAEAYSLAKANVKHEKEHWHRWIERRPVQMLILSLVMVMIGGALEMVPTFLVQSNVPTITSVKPYTPLELEGRDIYIREGCYNCHSQMIRPFRWETERYGEYSKAVEFVYDHPFQWGSKRTGPDLAREGVKSGRLYKSNDWHFNHMLLPDSVSNGSIMPRYPWLLAKLDVTDTDKKIRAMQALGVPYAEGYDKKAVADLQAQAKEVAKPLYDNIDALLITDETFEKVKAGEMKFEEMEMVALIAYLQRLGTDIYPKKSEK